MKRKIPTLDQIRRAMTPDHRILIEQTWRHFCAKGEWPILRGLYRDHGKKRVKAALTKLGGQVGREESHGSRWHRYSLTLMGVLLTKEGKALQRLMERFFHFQRELFQSYPEATEAKSEEIQQSLRLSQEDTSMLGRLLGIANFGGSSNGANKSWSVSAMEEAEEFPPTGELSVVFQKWLLRFRRVDEAVFDEQRRTQYSNAPFSFNLEAPTDSAHPSEITASLNRLRKIHHDPAKLGFLVMRFTPDNPFKRIVKVIKETAKKHGLAVIRADDYQFHGDVWGNVRTLLHGCGFGIVVYERIDKDEPNANVGLEIGYLMAMNKPVLLLKDRTVKSLQSDLAGKLYIPFDPHNPESSIPGQMTKWLKDYGIIVSNQP
jgi:hypothetical protein